MPSISPKLCIATELLLPSDDINSPIPGDGVPTTSPYTFAGKLRRVSCKDSPLSGSTTQRDRIIDTCDSKEELVKKLGTNAIFDKISQASPFKRSGLEFTASQRIASLDLYHQSPSMRRAPPNKTDGTPSRRPGFVLHPSSAPRIGTNIPHPLGGVLLKSSPQGLSDPRLVNTQPSPARLSGQRLVNRPTSHASPVRYSTNRISVTGRHSAPFHSAAYRREHLVKNLEFSPIVRRLSGFRWNVDAMKQDVIAFLSSPGFKQIMMVLGYVGILCVVLVILYLCLCLAVSYTVASRHVSAYRVVM